MPVLPLKSALQRTRAAKQRAAESGAGENEVRCFYYLSENASEDGERCCTPFPGRCRGEFNFLFARREGNVVTFEGQSAKKINDQPSVLVERLLRLKATQQKARFGKKQPLPNATDRERGCWRARTTTATTTKGSRLPSLRPRAMP